MTVDFEPSIFIPLAAGGLAGMAVDTILFPLDTIKTRIQSKQGFQAAGGLKNIYKGLSSAMIGSTPSASLFFCTYDTLKRYLTHQRELSGSTIPLGAVHMASASMGEIAACLVRVPTEVLKQRLQTNQYPSYVSAVKTVFRTEGSSGFYKGFITTVFREIPFTCIQFPLYEWLKKQWHGDNQGQLVPWKAALCGSVSGGIAAGITTPFDVAKTRIMLSSKTSDGPQYKGFINTLTRIAKEEGASALFKGVVPRVMWLSFGGSIFLGTYELVVSTLRKPDVPLSH